MDNVVEEAKLVKRSCLEIQANDFRGNMQIGASFCIADGYAITCAHVLGMIYRDDKQPNQIMLTDAEGRSIDGTFLAADIEHDIAIIGFEMADIPPIPIAASVELADGESVICMGSPLGYMNSVSSGVVSNIKGTKDSTFLVDMRINPGNSGGVIFSVDKEAAVGVASAVVYAAGDVQSTGIGVGINMTAIKHFLDKNGVPYLEQ